MVYLNTGFENINLLHITYQKWRNIFWYHKIPFQKYSVIFPLWSSIIRQHKILKMSNSPHNSFLSTNRPLHPIRSNSILIPKRSNQRTVCLLVLGVRFDLFGGGRHLVGLFPVVQSDHHLLLGGLTAFSRTTWSVSPEAVDVGADEDEDDRCVEDDYDLRKDGEMLWGLVCAD